MKTRNTLAASVSVLALLATALPASAQDMAALEAAAIAEGQLTTIALPHTWCGYGDVIAGFKAKYPGITVNELNPDAGSAEELEAVRANKGNMGPQAPDVLDVGLSFGPAGKEEGLIQPYKVSTWDSIPDDAKDADGYWYGDYYGVLAIGVNKSVITGDSPASFADLLKPDYANSVALAGDPRTGNNAIMSVYAAGLSTGARIGPRRRQPSHALDQPLGCEAVPQSQMRAVTAVGAARGTRQHADAVTRGNGRECGRIDTDVDPERQPAVGNRELPLGQVGVQLVGLTTAD